MMQVIQAHVDFVGYMLYIDNPDHRLTNPILQQIRDGVGGKVVDLPSGREMHNWRDQERLFIG